MQRNMIIWHVEDDPALSGLFVHMLGKIPGVTVLAFPSYAAVEQHLKTGPALPDLAILDMNLGAGPPGTAVGELIRTACSINPPEFVFLSAYREPEYLEAGILLGAAIYLRKGDEDIEFILYVIRVLLFRRALNQMVIDPSGIRSCLAQASTPEEMRRILVKELILDCALQFFGEAVHLWIAAGAYQWYGSETVSRRWFEPALLQRLDQLGERQVLDCSQLDQRKFPGVDKSDDRLIKLYQARGLSLGLRANARQMGTTKAENLVRSLSFFLQPIWIDRLMLMGDLLFAEGRRRRDRIGDTARICAAIARTQSNICLAAVNNSEIPQSASGTQRMDLLNQALSALSEQLNLLEQPVGRAVPVPLAGHVADVWRDLVERFGYSEAFMACRVDHRVAGNSSDVRGVFRRLLTMFANWADESGEEPGLEISSLREGDWVALDMIDQSPRRSRLFLDGMFQPFGHVPALDDDLEAWMGPSLALLILEERLGGRLEHLTDRLEKQQGHWLRVWLPAAGEECGV